MQKKFNKFICQNVFSLPTLLSMDPVGHEQTRPALLFEYFWLFANFFVLFHYFCSGHET